MAKGGGGGYHLPKRVFPVSLMIGEIQPIFSCRLILEASVHKKIFQIGATVLALKLEKLTYFSDHKDDIQS